MLVKSGTNLAKVTYITLDFTNLLPSIIIDISQEFALCTSQHTSNIE